MSKNWCEKLGSARFNILKAMVNNQHLQKLFFNKENVNAKHVLQTVS